jgi:predicted HicB family RNase H-like nuclease
MLEYKGYHGAAELVDGALHGTVLGLKDVVHFSGNSVKEIEQAFKESVDDYLDFCKERGEEPDKPFSGQYPLRMAVELHRVAYIASQREGKSLNAWVIEAIEERARKTC